MSLISKCSQKILFLSIFSSMSLITFLNTNVDKLFAILGKTLVIFLVSYFVSIFMRRFRTKEMVTSKGKAVLITGILKLKT